jgi:uncharacterized protein
MRIGLISDTHGYLHPRVFDLFAEVDHILHAGDVGDETVIYDLETIAPTNAVTGNVDGSPTVKRPLSFVGDFQGVRIAMTHGHMLDPYNYTESALKAFAKQKPRVIVYGHSHIASNAVLDGVQVINPGSAGRARFRAIPSVAILTIRGLDDTDLKFIEL